MEQVKYNFSLKNIPIPRQKDYLLELIYSVGFFVSNLRWRTFFFLNPSNYEKKETFGFKTTKPAPSISELKNFEDDLFELVKNVKFCQTKQNNLQSTLKENIRELNNSNLIYVAADKSDKHYKVTKDKHDEMMKKNITKDYKKTNVNDVDKVNKTDKKIAENYDLENRIYTFPPREAYITIKDHKENYETNTKFRLINPAKTDMGKISKKVLSKIVTSLRNLNIFNQWQNSHSVLEWFKNLQNKDNLCFIQFDIVEFYPSITESILKKSIDFARRYVKISDDEAKAILDTKKSLLFNIGQFWEKKGRRPFDVTMGSWDGAEVADLVGLYLLSQLQDLDLNIGLYRDD